MGVGYTRDDKVGGQLGYTKGDTSTDLYGVERLSERFELWGKTGYIFPVKRYRSIGLQYSYTYYSQDSKFGVRYYDATQQTAYANVIYQSIIGTTDHKFKTGASVLYDNYLEDFGEGETKKEETALGAFFEYTYSMDTRFTAVGGLRIDHNTLYGTW